MVEFGVANSVDLVPGGSDIAVTADNRQEYIQLVCKYKLDKQIAGQSRAFFNGLSDLIDPKCEQRSKRDANLQGYGCLIKPNSLNLLVENRPRSIWMT
jgi:hypothetical protein